MCTVGGPVDVELDEGIKAKRYKCKNCGGTFSSLGKHIICPTCGCDDCVEVA